MPGVAIVAIPSKDDYVWKISSEKVPHLTLLYLGEEVDDLLGGVEEYLEHVVDTSMRRFGLSVDRRGTLGPKEADVLFFSRYNVDMINEVRTYLLGNPSIAMAYHTAEQFPNYIPHLTLGYPESPANEDDRDYPGIQWVNFDTVALWTDDYDGPEFRLEDMYDEMAMSDDNEEVLAHYGVLGMKWGVRRSERQLARAAKSRKGASEDHNTASDARDKARRGGVKSLSNSELKTLVERMKLEQQYSQVVPPSAGSRVARAGGRFVGDVLLGVGRQQATRIANDQATQLLSKVFTK